MLTLTRQLNGWLLQQWFRSTTDVVLDAVVVVLVLGLSQG